MTNEIQNSNIKFKNITILAVDTSTDYLSLAVARGGRLLARYHRKAAMRHSNLLVPTIAKLLARAGMKPKAIDCFSVSIGPGSFTGLRISVATVKGLAYALGKRIVAVPTLDAIAHNAGDFKGVICAVLDAKKKKVYACIYRSDRKAVKRISGYLLLTGAELVEKIKRYGRILFIGDAAEEIFLAFSRPEKFIRRDWHPRAEVAARLGLEEARKGRFVAPEDLEPMYIYSKECDITGK